MNWMTRTLRYGIAFVVSVMFACSSAARAEEPLTEEAEAAEEAAPLRDDDAVSLYIRAAKLINADSPAASSLEYPESPPYGPEWEELAKASWEQNAPVFELVRRARSVQKATWPKGNLTYLGRARELANVVGDGALYQHLQGDDRGAIETIRDLLHVTNTLRKDTPRNELVRPLAATGIDALCANRLMVITSGIRLTDDEADAKALQTRNAKRLIEHLLAVPTAEETLKQVFRENYDALKNGPEAGRARETLNRVVAERGMAAMSLAAHLYRHERKRWPASTEELAMTLPRVPIDPFGDGEQTLGYMLVKGGLPDKSDRPLVYCRHNSKDGLKPRPGWPKYANYFGDGTSRPMGEQKQTGQFRDVARWTPGL